MLVVEEASLDNIKYNFVSIYLYVPDEGSLLPKYWDCTTSNGFELYIYIYIYIIGENCRES